MTCGEPSSKANGAGHGPLLFNGIDDFCNRVARTLTIADCHPCTVSYLSYTLNFVYIAFNLTMQENCKIKPLDFSLR